MVETLVRLITYLCISSLVILHLPEAVMLSFNNGSRWLLSHSHRILIKREGWGGGGEKEEERNTEAKKND